MLIVAAVAVSGVIILLASNEDDSPGTGIQNTPVQTNPDEINSEASRSDELDGTDSTESGTEDQGEESGQPGNSDEGGQKFDNAPTP